MEKTVKMVFPVMLAALAVVYVLYHGLGVGIGDQVDVTAGAAPVEQTGPGIVPTDIWYTEPVESVVFSHQRHAVELGFKCDTCHGSGLFQMEAMTAQTSEDFDMEGLSAGKYCGSCHSGKAAFDSDTQCARCHRGVKGYDEVSSPQSLAEPAQPASVEVSVEVEKPASPPEGLELESRDGEAPVER